jgi:hypothetical protein
MNQYVVDVISRGELYLEIERIRQLLVGMHKYPLPNRESQRETVSRMTKIFQALLSAKNAREEVIQDIRKDNCSNT